MHYDLKEIKVLDGHKLFVRFADKKQGVVDLSTMIRQGGVFSPLRKREYFEQAYIDPDWGVLCWPGDIDIAPETLYDAVKQVQTN